MNNVATHMLRVSAFLALLTVLISGVAGAQNDAIRLQQELNRTDRILEQAHEIVQHALGDRPRRLLDEARHDQDQAHGLFEVGGQGQLVNAYRKTLEARQKAKTAVEITKSQIRMLEQVRQTITEIRELAQRVRDGLEENPSEEASHLLEAGMQQLGRAQRAFDQQEYRAAIRFALFGRDLLQRAARLVLGPPTTDATGVEDEIARTDEFLGEAREASDGSAAAKARFEEAARVQRQAREQLVAGRPDRARRLTLRARELVLSALRAEDAAPDLDEVQAVIDRVDGRADRLTGPVAESSDRRAGELLATAREHLSTARTALSDGRAREALAEAKVADSVLGQVEDRLR